MVILFVGACSSTLWAGDHPHHGHNAHVHGLAELTLALEGNHLELNLVSPAANIVGFEHRATTPEQIQAVEQAKTTLESPGQLFVFAGTRCSLDAVMVDMAAVKHADKAHHGHDHEGEHHHGQGHKEYDEGHSEISANYRFRCEHGAELASILVELPAQFPGIEKIQAMWVTESRQGAVELSAGVKHIRLR